MITVSTDKKFKPEDFFHKTCWLGYNDIEFSMEYGYYPLIIAALREDYGIENVIVG